MKKISKIMAMMLALFMVLSLAAPAKAANYEPLDGDQVGTGGVITLDKYLLMDKNATTPASSFIYTVTYPTGDANGVYIAATADNPVVYSGPKNLKVSTTTQTTGVVDTNTLEFFTTDQAVSTSTTDITFDSSTQKYVHKEIKLDFSDVEFREPGVYRYWIQETGDSNNSSAIAYDTQVKNPTDATWRTIDVYVDATGDTLNTPDLEVKAVVVYEGQLDNNAAPKTSYDYSKLYVVWTDANDANITYEYDSTDATWVKKQGTTTTNITIDQIPGTATGTPAGASSSTTFAQAKQDAETTAIPNGAEPTGATKNPVFVNEYATYDIEFGKQVVGNQGSRDQYFKFKLTLTNLNNGTVLTVDTASNHDQTTSGTVAPNTATNVTYTGAVINTANTRDDLNGNGDPTGQQLVANASGVEFIVYLQHGQYVKINGIPAETHYELTEEDEAGYKKTEGTTKATDVNSVTTPNTHMDAVSGDLDGNIHFDEATSYAAGTTYYSKSGTTYTVETIADQAAFDSFSGTLYTKNANQNVYTGYTNTRGGVIPTGVILAAVPGTILAGGALLYLFGKKRHEEEE